MRMKPSEMVFSSFFVQKLHDFYGIYLSFEKSWKTSPEKATSHYNFYVYSTKVGVHFIFCLLLECGP